MLVVEILIKNFLDFSRCLNFTCASHRAVSDKPLITLGRETFCEQTWSHDKQTSHCKLLHESENQEYEC